MDHLHVCKSVCINDIYFLSMGIQRKALNGKNIFAPLITLNNKQELGKKE